MTTRAPARLERIKLDELSLVDAPANKSARIVLHKHDTQPRGYDTLEDAIRAIAAAEGCARHSAMEKAHARFPHLVEAYNAEAVAQQEAVAKTLAEVARPRISRALVEFEDLTDAIAKRDGCSRHEAMSRARQRHPDEFRAAYQEA